MTPLPPWYFIVTNFHYGFHSLFDLLFIIVGFATVAVVSQPGWRHHLRWASPAAAASVFTGLYRLLVDLHHYLNVGTATAIYLVSDLFNDAAVVLSFYSSYILWKMLRDLARQPTSPDPLAQTPASPDIWPPPPTRPVF